MRAEQERRRRLREAYAQGVLDIIGRDDDDDPEVLMGADVIDAEAAGRPVRGRGEPHPGRAGGRPTGPGPSAT